MHFVHLSFYTFYTFIVHWSSHTVEVLILYFCILLYIFQNGMAGYYLWAFEDSNETYILPFAK